MRRSVRVTVPVVIGRRSRHVPHRPVHRGAPAGQAAARADPRPIAGPGSRGGGNPAPRRSTPIDRQPTSGSATPRCSALTQELQSQLDALAAHSIDARHRPAEDVRREDLDPGEGAQFEAALAPARQIKAHAPPCRVILTVDVISNAFTDLATLTEDDPEAERKPDEPTWPGLVTRTRVGALRRVTEPTGGRKRFCPRDARRVGFRRGRSGHVSTMDRSSSGSRKVSRS